MNRWILTGIALGVLGLALFAFWISRDSGEPFEAGVSAVESLQADPGGFKQATEPRSFIFPDDHGPHEGYRTEWWYYTGNLFTESDRRFGFQFTIFRNQFLPDEDFSPEVESGWTTNQQYIAHLAISDLENGNHIHEERFSRGAMDLAGARADPFRIWLEDWEVRLVDVSDESLTEAPPGQNLPMKLFAATEQSELNLTMIPAKQPVFHGDDGLEPKGPEEGDASYYISFTRLETSGTIELEGETHHVEGLSWMDHEWSTSALSEEQEGWDWFSLQLSDDYDLMFYHLRNEDGTISPFSTGTLVDPDGNTTTLDPDDFQLEALDHWQSPYTGAEYPIRWRFEIPAEQIELEINTLLDDQEMRVSFTYYEGAIDAEGSRGGESLSGSGYVEMTGYEEAPGSRGGF